MDDRKRGRIARTTTKSLDQAWRPIIWDADGQEIYYGRAVDSPDKAFAQLKEAAEKHDCRDILPFKPFVPRTSTD